VEIVIRGIIHGIFEKLIKPYDIEDLNKAITERNNLIRYIREEKWKKQTMNKISKEITMLKKFAWAKESILRQVNINYIAGIIGEERPELLNVILTYKNGDISPVTRSGYSEIGLRWLQHQVIDIKKWISEVI